MPEFGNAHNQTEPAALLKDPARAQVGPEPAELQQSQSSAGEQSQAQPRRSQLSRDDRIRVLILRETGKSYAEIAGLLAITQRQVQHTVNAGHPTPKKRSGRPELLSESQKKELIEYVCASDENRVLSYTYLAKVPFAHWNVSEYPIRRALETAGFKRFPASSDERRLERERLRKQRRPVTRRHRQNRVRWAQNHLNWSPAQWRRILWTGEVLIYGIDRNGELRYRRVGEDADGADPESESVLEEGSDLEAPLGPGMQKSDSRVLVESVVHTNMAPDQSQQRHFGIGVSDAHALPPSSHPTHPTQQQPMMASGHTQAVGQGRHMVPGPNGMVFSFHGQQHPSPSDPLDSPGVQTPTAAGSPAVTQQPVMMVWSSVWSNCQGPALCWNDSWGPLDQNSFIAHILPLIKETADRARTSRPEESPVRVMLDSSASFHRSRQTAGKFEEERLSLLDDGAKWPAQSPDLNPLVDMWEWVSDWVREECVMGAPKTEAELKELIMRAWREAVTPERLELLLAEMPQRCQDVISVRGGWTRWWKPRKERAPMVPPSALAAQAAAASAVVAGEVSTAENGMVREQAGAGNPGRGGGAESAIREVGLREAAEDPSQSHNADVALQNSVTRNQNQAVHQSQFPQHLLLGDRSLGMSTTMGMGISQQQPMPLSLPVSHQHAQLVYSYSTAGATSSPGPTHPGQPHPGHMSQRMYPQITHFSHRPDAGGHYPLSSLIDLHQQRQQSEGEHADRMNTLNMMHRAAAQQQAAHDGLVRPDGSSGQAAGMLDPSRLQQTAQHQQQQQHHQQHNSIPTRTAPDGFGQGAVSRMQFYQSHIPGPPPQAHQAKGYSIERHAEEAPRKSHLGGAAGLNLSRRAAHQGLGGKENGQ